MDCPNTTEAEVDTNGQVCPESESEDLQAKVESLKKKLKSCKSDIHHLQKKLTKTKQQYKSSERYNEDLRKQVDKLSAEIHERKKRERNRKNAETQTDADYSGWTESDYYNYYYGGYYGGETAATEAQNASETTQEGTDASQHVTESIPQNSESAPEASNMSEQTEASSIADMLRATAEEVASQTGFVFDENSGMYYDHSTGFYYDSTTQLYYDNNTGIYYYYDTESGRYQFHSRIEVQSYPVSSEQSHDKKKNKRRTGVDRPSSKDKSFRDDSDKKSSRDGRRLVQKRKRKASPSGHKRRSCSPDSWENGKVNRNTRGRDRSRKKGRSRARRRSSSYGSASEPEEGEITESDQEREPVSPLEPGGSGISVSEGEELPVTEEAWPPCVRVTVIRSPVLQPGTLFIITADKPATIGREKEMDHTIRIPEMGVSKYHAEVHFEPDQQCYVLVDQGSQNGTVINGNRILNPKATGEPCVLAHGDEIKMGETVLSFHIHAGNDTCDGCEPGQVMAHLSRHKKEQAGQLQSKEDKEQQRQKELKQMKEKYGLKSSEYEGGKALKNSKYKDRAEVRRQVVGSEGVFQRDDAPASVHVEIAGGNKGRKMLEKMGWKQGDGLGKDGSGRKEPIQLQIRKSQAGLGAGGTLSVDDMALPQSKNQKNWEKARERFADTCVSSCTSAEEKPKSQPWVKSEVEEQSAES